MNYRTTLQSIIRCKKIIQPTAQHGYAPQKKAGHHALLPPFFSVIVFAAAQCSTLFFSIEKIVRRKPIEKKQTTAPTHEAKNNAIKKWGELLKHKVAL